MQRPQHYKNLSPRHIRTTNRKRNKHSQIHHAQHLPQNTQNNTPTHRTLIRNIPLSNLELLPHRTTSTQQTATRTNITHMGKQTKPHNTTTHRIRINPTNKKLHPPYPDTLSIYLIYQLTLRSADCTLVHDRPFSPYTTIERFYYSLITMLILRLLHIFIA